MLRLENIVKTYTVGDNTVEALRGVTMQFRKSEFVSILGPSGCGKTTLLNIVGGLDSYTSGDLVINGVSTKEYKDGDWDAYRNHSVGFVFQSYNLIPHQSVLANVELALTLSGVSRGERRKRAKEALEKVGLGDQLHKKPNQMSGGQMQRVAIARALVNDPEIILADEPTGALDSETSVQIMDLLKEIAADRLVIMVTHNPELAQRYSTRIVRLMDGRVTDDSNPFDGEETTPAPVRKGKARMHFFTALSLSFRNLLTKKARTILTAFAGSIGIIGIALILALSGGARAYIDRVEEETLSSYPLTIERSTMDMAGMMSSFMGSLEGAEFADDGYIYGNPMMQDMFAALSQQQESNDLTAFKQFLEADGDGITAYLSDIEYAYTTPLNVYRADTQNGITQVNPSQVFSAVGMGDLITQMPMASMSGVNVWMRLSANTDLIDSQYDVLAGHLPTAWDEAVLIADGSGRVTDYTLYALGLLDIDDLQSMMADIAAGKEVQSTVSSYTYEELLDLTFKVVPETDYYAETSFGWQDMREDPVYMKQTIDSAREVRIVGVLKVADDAVGSSAAGQGYIGYHEDLMLRLLDDVAQSDIVLAQQRDTDTDVFTGKPFADSDAAADLTFDASMLSPEQQAYFASLSPAEQQALITQYTAQATSSATYEGNLTRLGVASEDSPGIINLYPVDFEAKEAVTDIIRAYNDRMEAEGQEGKVIRYTDYVGLMMSSVTTIINAISYILIAFVAISLVVSSIMIGIITYISVLERTKEIGVLRSLGASRRDISRVFNAETLIIGFTAGALGIGVTLLLVLLANGIIEHLTGLADLAILPMGSAMILIGISMLLTLIAGFIPSRIAAKKDPVVALRTE